MKRIIMFIVSLAAFAAVASAEDKPVTYEQLPAPAKVYLESNFPGVKMSFASKDDDFFRPDYTVMLTDGTKLEFSYSGGLKQVSSSKGLSPDLIPVSIRDYVQAHYPGAGYVEYEIGKKTYEVKLNNRMELKFNRNFTIIEVDY